MSMKYVMIRRGHQSFPVIFPEHMVHEDVAQAIITMLDAQEGKHKARSIAAGDCSVREVICAGSSSTLKMESRGKQDENLILMGSYSGYWEDDSDVPPMVPA